MKLYQSSRDIERPGYTESHLCANIPPTNLKQSETLKHTGPWWTHKQNQQYDYKVVVMFFLTLEVTDIL